MSFPDGVVLSEKQNQYLLTFRGFSCNVPCIIVPGNWINFTSCPRSFNAWSNVAHWVVFPARSNPSTTISAPRDCDCALLKASSSTECDPIAIM